LRKSALGVTSDQPSLGPFIAVSFLISPVTKVAGCDEKAKQTLSRLLYVGETSFVSVTADKSESHHFELKAKMPVA
jgi:hypothetical protein